MVRKLPPKSRRHSVEPEVEQVKDVATDSAKALTVNVPLDALNRARTRASLEGRTLSSVVSDGLQEYGAGLGDVLARLGLGAPGKG